MVIALKEPGNVYQALKLLTYLYMHGIMCNSSVIMYGTVYEA